MADSSKAKAPPPAGASRVSDAQEHLLHFGTLGEAEATLRRLDALWRERRDARDAQGLRRVLDLARQGRRRAQMIAGNRRVSPVKRAEKDEIQQWFRVWLETPEVFFDWLEIRKQVPDFIEKFGGRTTEATSDETEAG